MISLQNQSLKFIQQNILPNLRGLSVSLLKKLHFLDFFPDFAILRQLEAQSLLPRMFFFLILGHLKNKLPINFLS